MDFGIFGFSPEQVQEFRTFLATQQQQAQGQAGNNQQQQSNATDGTTGAAAGMGASGNEQQSGNNGGAGAGDLNNQGEPVLMHNAQHCGVVCDICNTEIRGFRYKCMQCPDYDLCAKCEHKGHHAGHVMMRISFPEQARDAIRKYLQNGGISCPPSPEAHPRGPHHGPHPHHRGPHHHGPHHGPPSFEGVFQRSPCVRRGRGSGLGGEDDSDRPATAPGCPYGMGKKEFKKWSKWMKRAATHQHRSAEAYARAAAASGTGAAAADASAEGAEGVPDAMDFAAVASQIQEFLNYWGIPVDVVELYDQFGNRGQPANSAEQQSNAPGTATASQDANASTTAATNEGTQENTASAQTQASGTQNQQPGSPAAAYLAENMEQMRINEVQNNPSAPRDDSLLMDMDNDNSGWTILDNSQSREQSPGNSNTETQQIPATSPAPQGQNQNQASPAGSMNSNNGNGNTSTPFASAGSSTTSSGQSQPTSVPSAPTFPAGVPNVPLYPVLNTPQIQQILQGVSSAVNNVVRSIPIVTDPRGPMGTNVTNSTSGQIPATGPNGQPGANPELNARSMKTLNQLLAMGFSNEGGYLTRLVLAKNGDLEAVLSSLFPN